MRSTTLEAGALAPDFEMWAVDGYPQPLVRLSRYTRAAQLLPPEYKAALSAIEETQG